MIFEEREQELLLELSIEELDNKILYYNIFLNYHWSNNIVKENVENKVNTLKSIRRNKIIENIIDSE
jgi:hypothetical protein